MSFEHKKTLSGCSFETNRKPFKRMKKLSENWKDKGPGTNVLEIPL
jgi:hypothetical protein